MYSEYIYIQEFINCMYASNKVLILIRHISCTEVSLYYLICLIHPIFKKHIILTRSDIIAGSALRGNAGFDDDNPHLNTSDFSQQLFKRLLLFTGFTGGKWGEIGF